MRVLQIVTQLEPGGAQRVARVLDSELRSHGHEVTTEFIYFKRPMEDWGPERCWFSERPSVRDVLDLARRLRNRARETDSDVVLTHTHFANAMTLAIPRSVPCVAVHHGPRSTHSKAARWAEWFTSKTGRLSANIAVSPAVAKELAPEKFENVFMIPNPGPSLDQVPGRWQAASHPSIACIGRLAPQKNQRLLVEALPLLQTHIEKAAVYGEGPLRDSLLARAHELGADKTLSLEGELPNDALLTKLRADSPVYVAASTWEAMPMSLLEVAGCGLPIVASDIEAHRWLLGDDAVFFDPTSPEDLARAIDRTLQDNAGANERIQNLFTRLNSEYRREIVTGRYEQALNQVTSRR